MIDQIWIVKSSHGPYSRAARAAAKGTRVPLSYRHPQDKGRVHRQSLP